MVSSWDGCWGCSCSAIVDSGATQSVLFVGGVLLLYWVAYVWVSFKSVFVFPDLYCQSATSVCVSQSASAVTKSLLSPVGASCQSVKKTWKAVCWYLEKPQDSCSGPALRHNWDFNIATAQSQQEAMQVFIRINEICSSDTVLTQAFVPGENV